MKDKTKENECIELRRRITELEGEETRRKLVEEALRESEARLSEAQRVAHIGNWVWNLQTGELIWSDENYRIFGLSPVEVKPSLEAFLNTIHPDDMDFVKKSIDDALNGKNPYDIDIRIIRPDGSNRIVHAKGRVDFDKACRPFRMFGTVQDITERKRAEEELLKTMESLREEKARTEAIIGAMGDGISIQDTDFRVLYQNQVHKDIIGDHKGEYCYIAYEHREHVCEGCPVAMTINDGKIHTAERSATTANGISYFEITASPLRDSTGKITAGIEIGRDITQRKQMLEQLQQKNQFVKAILESLPYPFYVIESTNYVISMANSAAHKRGLGEGSYCYAAHKSSKPCESKDHQCPLKEVKKAKKPVIVEHIHYDEDGNPRNVEVHCYPIFDSERNVNQAIEYALDITERKKSEEMRLENARLSSINKAKSEFLATMSHELRTPLNSIIGFSELLKQGSCGELDSKQERYVDNIFASGKHLLGLISDILDLSKVEAGKMELVIERVSVPEIINESISLIKESAAKHNVVLKKELDSQLDIIEADRQRVKQVLFNLLSNAVKFSKPEGGTVTITVKKEADMAMFSVRDTGIGIKEENMGRLFNTFEQLDSSISRKYQGTGLGLAISRKLVELHGGKIMAESKYGEGSTFTFYLPITSKTCDPKD
jgi:PAS domain S-box-containing protein